jgi:GNAT superfamily N-acetyltransferase
MEPRMTTRFAIRRVEQADFPRWLPLWHGYNAFYGREGKTALPDAITRATWERFHNPAEPVWGLVADDGTALLGLVHYLFHRSTTMAENTCYLQDLFTAPEARGRGVGRALIEAVYTAAREAGTGRVYWHTHETNATAMALYDQVADKPGFVMYRKLL